jgi:hypothetical protein
MKVADALPKPMLLAALLLLPAGFPPGFAADPANSLPSSAARPDIVRFTPGMTMSTLAGRRDTDLVELSSGRRVRVAELRRLDAWGKRARSATERPIPAALQARPASSGRLVENAGDLAEALKGADGETIQLPNGQRATVGQVKFLRPLIEQRLGRPISDVPQRPKLSGPARKVTADANWKEILQQPDGTVLESPDGTRITVGELKHYFPKSRSVRTSKPSRGSGDRPADPAATERR